MKNISYLLSLLLAFSYVSFADEEVKEAPKESEEVAEDVSVRLRWEFLSRIFLSALFMA